MSQLALLKYEQTKSFLLQLHLQSGINHLGSSLSCLEIVFVLFKYYFHQGHDFILSKGHACSAIYSTLASAGLLSKSEFSQIYKNGSPYHVHISKKLVEKFPNLQFPTGSLGHGLPLAAGLAYGELLLKKSKKTFCLMSEGDCNEGTTWEAAQFAAHHELQNLICLIDHNKIQALGKSEQVLKTFSYKNKWESFGFEVFNCHRGNSIKDVQITVAKAVKSKSLKPKCIVFHTEKGNGISEIEGTVKSHYAVMTPEMFNTKGFDRHEK